MLFLRWVHFFGGVFWIGTLFYLGMVQLPALSRARTGGLSEEHVSRLNSLLVITSMSSIVAGVSMALIISQLDTGVFFSKWGLSILGGGVLALVALVATFAGVLPALQRLSSSQLDETVRGMALRLGQRWLNLTMALGSLVLLMMAMTGSPAF